MSTGNSDGIDQAAGTFFFGGAGALLAVIILYTAETEIGMGVWKGLSEVLGVTSTVLVWIAAGFVFLAFVSVPPILLLGVKEQGGSTLATFGRYFMAVSCIVCAIYAIAYLLKFVSL